MESLRRILSKSSKFIYSPEMDKIIGYKEFTSDNYNLVIDAELQDIDFPYETRITNQYGIEENIFMPSQKGIVYFLFDPDTDMGELNKIEGYKLRTLRIDEEKARMYRQIEKDNMFKFDSLGDEI